MGRIPPGLFRVNAVWSSIDLSLIRLGLNIRMTTALDNLIFCMSNIYSVVLQT